MMRTLIVFLMLILLPFPLFAQIVDSTGHGSSGVSSELIWVILGIVAFAISELMPFLPTKSNGILQLIANLIKALKPTPKA